MEEREERRADLQFLGKPGSLGTTSSRLPPRSPGRQAQKARRRRLPGPQAANARPQRVLAESPEPRVWVTHCLRVAPALTKLRREPSTVPIACVGDSSGDFSWSAHEAKGGGEGVPKAWNISPLPRGSARQGKVLGILGVFSKHDLGKVVFRTTWLVS